MRVVQSLTDQTGAAMNTYRVTAPEMAIVAATRGMAGLGAGLLISSLLTPNTRRTLGWTLLAIGAVSTVPILMALTGKRDGARESPELGNAATGNGDGNALNESVPYFARDHERPLQSGDHR